MVSKDGLTHIVLEAVFKMRLIPGQNVSGKASPLIRGE
jgi:hypothetical protein